MGHGRELRLGSIINSMENVGRQPLLVLLLVQRYGLRGFPSMGMGVHSQHSGGPSREVTIFSNKKQLVVVI